MTQNRKNFEQTYMKTSGKTMGRNLWKTDLWALSQLGNAAKSTNAKKLQNCKELLKSKNRRPTCSSKLNSYKLFNTNTSMSVMSEPLFYYQICHIICLLWLCVVENYFNNKHLLNVRFYILTTPQNVNKYTKLYLFNIFKGLIYFNMTIKFIQV